jgi:hypothetical protein
MTIIGAQPCQFNGKYRLGRARQRNLLGMPAIGSQRRLLQALMLSPAAQPRRFCPRILRWELAKFAKAVSAQPFRRSLTDLADEKVSFLDAAILIFSPFAGLRPSRSGVALTLNFPNPGSDTSAPLAAASKIFFMMSSTIDLASTLLTPRVSAIFATSSAVFIQASSRIERAGCIA